MIIKNGRVALPGENDFQVVDIRVEGEIIAGIGSDLSGDDEVIDAEGLFVLPGGIDPHVHFDDPGFTEREDFYHGSCHAAFGGITTVIDMPCTSIPPVINGRNLLEKLKIIENKAVVDFGMFGGVPGSSFEEGFPACMEELSGHVLGFKTYFISGMESFTRVNHFQFKKVLEKARELVLPVLLHAEDYDYVSDATVSSMKEGVSPINYYRSRPEAAEVLAVLSAVELVKKTGANLHIVHIGTARAGELLRENDVTGETGPHYLEFDVRDFERIGSPLKCTPPVKLPENKERLWKLLNEGVISFVASDHAPCTEDEKNTGSIWTEYSGIPGCGTLLPYMFSEGYMKGRISLQRLVEVTSEGAARRYGLFKRKGSIEAGKDADLVLMDPVKSWIVKGKEFYSKGKITPFEGMELKGLIVKTILRGKVIYTAGEGIKVEGGYGRLVKKEAG